MNLCIYETQISRTKRIASPGRISSPADAAWACRDLALMDREHLVRLDLDTRGQLIGRETVHIGTADTTVISARDILRGAILNGAVKIIIAHNHPSGDPSPSPEDLSVTTRMVDAGQTVGLPVVDSLVIGHDGRFHSCLHHTSGRLRDIYPQPHGLRQESLLKYSPPLNERGERSGRA